MSSVLYDGKDVIVYVGSNGSKRGVITFGGWRQDPFGNRPAASAQGFGEGAFLKHGIDEFHVVPRANHWYQTDEMKAVEELARSPAADWLGLRLWPLSTEFRLVRPAPPAS